ncbi:MAG: 7TM diverse intracellular signaling domain-containing protein [Acidobacteriota bacterium]
MHRSLFFMGRSVFAIWTCLWLGVLAWAGPAAAFTVPAQVPVRVTAGPVSIGLDRHAQVLEDPTGRMSLREVQATSQPWVDFHGDAFNPGFSRSVWWARVRLQHAGLQPARRIIEVGTPLQDRLDFYVVDAQGAQIEHVATGDRLAFATRPILTRVPALLIQLPPGQPVDVYVRMASHDGLQEAVALRMWQPVAYAEALQTETMAFGLYYGGLVTVLLYNLFLFLSTRQRSFGIYTAYVSAFLLWSFTFRGYAFQYLWPDQPLLNNQLLPIAAASCYVTFGLFVMDYLETRRNVPLWVHRTLQVATFGNALCVTPALFGHYALPFALSIPFGVTEIITALSLGIWLCIKGNRPARYFIIAFTLLAVGVVLYYLRVLGAVPSNVVTENFLQIGSALELLLLAFGLADQMNTLRADKLVAERQALAAQTVLNTELESLVKRRTRALESANERLAAMAITDDLTGAYNRRHFNSVFHAEVARHLRNHSPLAFCMLDIDQFKLYNDRYGHLAGDSVLQRVASAINEQLQRAGDQFFRLGGEEFGILLNVDEPPEKTLPFIEKIREAIEALAIPHEMASHQVVTASFGLVWLSGTSSGVRAEEVYAAADQLLYQAKAQGRNCVVSRAM